MDKEDTGPIAADRARRRTTGDEITQPVTPRPASESAVAEMDESPFFAGEESERFRSEWLRIQTAFVDDPRAAVQQADGLVKQVIDRLGAVFGDERSRLEAQWSRGGEAETESLRVALQRYRAFFSRLLSI